MKKLGLLALVAGIVLMAGCAGDDPAGPGGTLADVSGVTISASSAGRDVILTWTALTDVDGYKVWFRATSTASWTEVDDVTSNTGTHSDATSAGEYVVTAYKGSDSSANNSNMVDTYPTDVTTTYTIYDNYSPTTQPSGFIFGTTSGQTGSAASTSFHQDIYAFDELGPVDGDTNVQLLSGDFGSFGNGNTTWMAEPVAAGYCEAFVTGGSAPWSFYDYGLYSGDVRVFLHLENGNYVKMYNIAVAADPASDHGTMVSFSYEIQTNGLTLFTSK